ncbi:MAG: hypothetical protein HYZ00_12160 [Candidatus Hydrogenedentes bacterium]|nr:hypothetical protein [Candidatus Hydrogenedentota bacterium]
MPLADELHEALCEIPVIDVHTHLVGGKLGARGLHDLLLYHMSISDLYAAGCPSGTRLTEYPGWPERGEAARRIEEALPFLAYTRNTSTAWGLRTLLAHLYQWTEPISAENWRRLDDQVRERAEDRAWHRDILGSMRVQRVGTEIARREDGVDDDILQYALEWAFFTRCQWGEYDTALYELERCWGKAPGTATPIGAGKRPAVERLILSVEDVHEAVDHYVKALPTRWILSTATHISTDLDLRVVDEVEMSQALARRPQAGPEERNVYASYVNEVFLAALERHAPQVLFQFSLGAEPLPHETACRVSQHTIAQVAEMISRHAGLKFQCFLASRHANQSLCTLCRELPNFSLSGYWWHSFFPGSIQQIIEERLDMLPLNRQIGFFSDAYCVEWAYAKLHVVRRCLARVLAQKIELGQYSREEALAIARSILYETPQSLNGFQPSPALNASSA